MPRPLNTNTKFDRSAEFLMAVANPQRLQILGVLINKEICVSDLARVIGISQSSLSQHLAKLRNADLVQTRQCAQTVFYKCVSAKIYILFEMLEKMENINIGLGATTAGLARNSSTNLLDESHAPA